MCNRKVCIFAALSFIISRQRRVAHASRLGLFLCLNVNYNIRRSTPCGIGNDRKPTYKDLAAGRECRYFYSYAKSYKL